MNIEGELISALCDLEKERKKNKQLKEDLSKMKESIQDSINPEETKKLCIYLKVKLEQLEEKERIQVELEIEIVSLRGKLHSKDIKQKFENSTKILD